MAVQFKASVTNSPSYAYHGSTLKIKPFEFKKPNITIQKPSHPIVLTGKKPTGKSWINKDFLNHGNQADTIAKKTKIEPTIEELEYIINTKFHL
jgi:hypothetical protein